MRSLKDYIQALETHQTPQVGHGLDMVVNEEYTVHANIAQVHDTDMLLDINEHDYALLERAGLLELAGDPGYQGSTGTSLGGKPATPAQAAAQPAPSGARNPTAGAKPTQSAASLRQSQAAAAASGSPAPTPVGTKVYPATDAMTARMAQQTTGRAGTYTAPRPAAKPGAAPNANQAAVDAANAVQRGQMDKLAGLTPADGSPATTATEPAPQSGPLGIAAQANVAGSPTATEPTTNNQTEPAASEPIAKPGALGVMPQANVAGSPTATAAPQATGTTNAVRSGSGQEVKTGTGGTVTTRTPDEIAATGPLGSKLPTAADRAQGEKNWQGIKNFFTGDKSSTPATTAPATLGEDPEFARIMQLAGVRRG